MNRERVDSRVGGFNIYTVTYCLYGDEYVINLNVPCFKLI